MQIIECENCHGYFELPEDSFERLNRVLKAGSGSIYIKCPYHYCPVKAGKSVFEIVET